jgi:hypothetical protein
VKSLYFSRSPVKAEEAQSRYLTFVITGMPTEEGSIIQRNFPDVNYMTSPCPHAFYTYGYFLSDFVEITHNQTGALI